jgi:hypothetical protein
LGFAWDQPRDASGHFGLWVFVFDTQKAKQKNQKELETSETQKNKKRRNLNLHKKYEKIKNKKELELMFMGNGKMILKGFQDWTNFDMFKYENGKKLFKIMKFVKFFKK